MKFRTSIAPTLLLLLATACGGKEQEATAGEGGGEGEETGSADASGSGGTASSTSSGTASESGGSASGGTSTGTGSGTGTTSGSGGTDGSSSSSSSSGGDTEGGTDSAGFITPPDGGVAGQCDPFAQDCPDGEKCTAWSMGGGPSTDANKCVADMGTGEEFDTCTRTEDNDDCAKGLFCMTKTSGSTGEGYCQKFCSVAMPDTCPDGTCVPWNDGTKPVCEYSCNPILQDCDQPNFGCYPGNNGGFFCKLSGFEEGMGQDGDACVVVQSCEPGLICLDGASQADCAGTSCCSQVCDVANPGDVTCDGVGEECVAYFAEGMAPPGYEDVGVCALPA